MTAADVAESLGTARLSVYRSTRVESLLDSLVTRLRAQTTEPGADPFTPFTIVVQSRGMQRWLSQHLAERLDDRGRGVAANLSFLFPGAVIDGIVDACHATDTPDPWAADRLVWAVVSELVTAGPRPELDALAAYLDPISDGLPASSMADRSGIVDRRLWSLARSIAEVFDRYVLYRPKLAQAWSSGRHVGPDGAPLTHRDGWQPYLWMRLVERLGDPTRRLQSTIDQLGDRSAVIDEDALPSPLSSFGISAFPPRHLEVLAALAVRAPVHLFVPTASTDRWDRIATAVDEGSGRPEARHPLLVSCGRLFDDAAEQMSCMAARPGADVPQEAFPSSVPASSVPTSSAPARRTLLSVLQEDLRADRTPGGDTVAGSPSVDSRFIDRSVQVHACHGPARQAEVLRDAILRALADDPTLEPRDVLVMTPDIDLYAPLVQAAFAGGAGITELPVTVADRQVGRTNPVAEALLGLLELAGGRATASQVLDLLGRPVIRQRVGLTLDEIEALGGWVTDSGVRWGIDAAHRARHGQPAEPDHTWRAGLDRLLLGAVMADEDDRTVSDVTPFDDVEGGAVESVGRLADACARLFSFVEACWGPRDLDDWVDMLVHGLETCVATPPAERWQLQEVRAGLEDLREAGGGHAGPLLELDAVRSIVEGSLGHARGAAGYETGAVTLCALVPMRSIPHRVVCLLGLDDGAFPRRDARPGFDLVEREPQPGDRDRRAEDRSLFLEALLSARDTLIVTTTGRDVRTGEPIPPAVPLAELLDVLERCATTRDDGRSLRELITWQHPLQAFSPANFGGGERGAVEPVSFDPVARETAEAIRSGRRRSETFIDADLDSGNAACDGSADGPLDLDDLVRSLAHPTRFLLERRLGVFLRDIELPVEDHEPVELDPRTRSALGRNLLGRVEPDVDAWIRARLGTGTVPSGTPGRVRLGQVVDDVERLRDHARDRRLELTGLEAGAGIDARLHLPVGGRILEGRLDGLFPISLFPGRGLSRSGTDHENVDSLAGESVVRLVAAYVRPRPEQLLRAWVVHLALSAAGVTDLHSVVITRGASGMDGPEEIRLDPLHVDPRTAAREAASHLEDLLAIHDRSQRQCIPLFPAASFAYARRRQLRSARRAFEPNVYVPGSGDRDAYVAHVYGEDATLDDVLVDAAAREDFVATATTVWGAPIEHRARSVARPSERAPAGGAA